MHHDDARCEGQVVYKRKKVIWGLWFCGSGGICVFLVFPRFLNFNFSLTLQLCTASWIKVERSAVVLVRQMLEIHVDMTQKGVFGAFVAY